MNTINKKTMLYFFLPAAIFMLVFLLYPLITLFVDSFSTILNDGSREFAGLNNYIKAFSSATFLKSFKNTIIYVFLAVALETVLGLFLSIVLTHKYKGFTALRTLMLSPLMIAPIVAGLIWKFMLSNQFGIINTLLVKLGLIESTSSILWLADPKITLISVVIADVWLTTPFMMLMFLAGIQGISDGLYEAAVMEGASKFQMIFKIIIPNIKPVLFSALVVRIIDAARSFDIIWAMTQGGPNNSSELLSVHIYKMLQRYSDIGLSSAMAVIFIVVLVSITLVFRKKIND
ncbi:TPA: sugar ABC transporter permease [Enterococcus faecium]|uniref:carbohydrate ABC transporter permease n=1 Tax=Enterococcus TaxID=1350 RepID=UPI001A092CA6|nr:sugar ABC transporter permease [Enterococcus faecium]EGP5625133.1 sugar ABC transporter permease [Enterococcus faecium]MBX9062355.1 sugar ABC transporter permease [Enterococcus faecium]